MNSRSLEGRKTVFIMQCSVGIFIKVSLVPICARWPQTKRNMHWRVRKQLVLSPSPPTTPKRLNVTRYQKMSTLFALGKNRHSYPKPPIICHVDVSFAIILWVLSICVPNLASGCEWLTKSFCHQRWQNASNCDVTIDDLGYNPRFQLTNLQTFFPCSK